MVSVAATARRGNGFDTSLSAISHIVADDIGCRGLSRERVRHRLPAISQVVADGFGCSG